MRKSKLTPAVLRDPRETTELTITGEVFRGANAYEYRGLSDAFTRDQIAAIADNPGAGDWRWRAMDALLAD